MNPKCGELQSLVLEAITTSQKEADKRAIGFWWGFLQEKRPSLYVYSGCSGGSGGFAERFGKIQNGESLYLCQETIRHQSGSTQKTDKINH